MNARLRKVRKQVGHPFEGRALKEKTPIH